MCGIFGIWNYGAAVDVRALERATTAIHHRGPDDEGYLLLNTQTGANALCAGRETNPALELPYLDQYHDSDFNLGLGFRRLSILDLSPAGHQPMLSADGSCWIIFNGEIYNYVELRAELLRLGHEFHTGTDTEVILAAYQQWGGDCLKRFVGMWALAICDLKERQLFLARDPFGIKPLYYARNNQRLVFGSEIKALLAFGQVTRAVNPQRLYDYLTSGLTDQTSETLFTDIHQLLPAHLLAISFDEPARAKPEQYWRIELDNKLEVGFDEAAEHLRSLFLDNVRLHLRSDVRVGAALSGGIDSSAIVMGMRIAEPEMALHTVSYVADDPSVSEERWVDMVGAAAHSEIHKTHPTPNELVTDLDQLIATQDEPFGSTSIYAQYRVFRRAREAGITVMLDGQGADEMLAGYRSYLVPRLASLLRSGHWLRANTLFLKTANLPDVNRKELLVGTGGLLLPHVIGRQKNLTQGLRQLAARAGLVGGSTLSALNNEWFSSRGATPWRYANGQHRDLLRATLHNTLVQTSLPMLLRYEDRNSMAHSIESRVPFLTTALVEFVFALPEEYLIASDGTSKSVFRHAMRGIVSDAILDRKDKIGFATPERRWLDTLSPWINEVLGRAEDVNLPMLDLPVIRKELTEVLAGERGFDFRVWRWLNVISWARKLDVSF
jgi:asparagine synthase (glutamine-hydrolysing)